MFLHVGEGKASQSFDPALRKMALAALYDYERTVRALNDEVDALRRMYGTDPFRTPMPEPELIERRRRLGGGVDRCEAIPLVPLYARPGAPRRIPQSEIRSTR